MLIYPTLRGILVCLSLCVCVIAGLVIDDKTNPNPHWPLVFSQFPPPDARKRITRISICRAISPPGGHLLYLSRSNVLAAAIVCMCVCVCACVFVYLIRVNFY